MASEKITCSYAVKAKSETRNTFFEIIWEIIKKIIFMNTQNFQRLQFIENPKTFSYN